MPGRLGRGLAHGRTAGGRPASRHGQRRGLAAHTLEPVLDPAGTTIVGIDMPLGLLETGWREADRAARGLLGPRRSSVFAIPPRAVWAEESYPAANLRCRALTGQGFSVQAWGLRAKLLEANEYREGCGHPMYEVHPELAFGAMAGAPLRGQQAHCCGPCCPAPGAGRGGHRDPRAGPGRHPGRHPGCGRRGLECPAYRGRAGRHDPG